MLNGSPNAPEARIRDLEGQIDALIGFTVDLAITLLDDPSDIASMRKRVRDLPASVPY